MTVLGREAHRREDEEETRDPTPPGTVAPSSLRDQHEPGRRDREHGDDADAREVVAPGDREDRGVDVRHERRLAVDRVVVQPTTVVDHLGLGREEGLVGVEDRNGERGKAEPDGQEEERAEDEWQPPARDRG